MGTYFTAVVNHNLDEHEIYTLPDLLNSTWHAVVEVPTNSRRLSGAWVYT